MPKVMFIYDGFIRLEVEDDGKVRHVNCLCRGDYSEVVTKDLHNDACLDCRVNFAHTVRLHNSQLETP